MTTRARSYTFEAKVFYLYVTHRLQITHPLILVGSGGFELQASHLLCAKKGHPRHLSRRQSLPSISMTNNIPKERGEIACHYR